MRKIYTRWHYLAILLTVLFSILYALPNLYGEDPAVQMSPRSMTTDLPTQTTIIHKLLATKHITARHIERINDHYLIRLSDTDQQILARDILKKHYNESFIVALNLAPKTPAWLKSLGAAPLKLGLDLRGGVHFLLDVDTDAVISARINGDKTTISQALKAEHLRYTRLYTPSKTSLAIRSSTQAVNDSIKQFLTKKYPSYQITSEKIDQNYALLLTLSEHETNAITDYAIDQTLIILNNRVNELGVSEAVVQRQGRNQISVDLPGIQDTARAKDILGKTATLRFQLAKPHEEARTALAHGTPPGTKLYQDEYGNPVLIENQIILAGDSITYATASFADGQPEVQIQLGGGGESFFHRVTAESVGRLLAVIYIETQIDKHIVNGKTQIKRTNHEKVISVANINSPLGNSFRITGLQSPQYAENLALLLRSGSLSAPVAIVQEVTIGPSMGKSNINKGIYSLVIGSLLVFIFMMFYYRFFGLVANLALVLNIIIIVALLSLLDATLTLPGIAGIILTVGMAVDANVLINERIREELRLGQSAMKSVDAGYEKAFSTIVDANVTTLIVALILFTLGSGSVKGFAITLIIGLLVSMFTAVFVTRGLVNFWYAKRASHKLSIGI